MFFETSMNEDNQVQHFMFDIQCSKGIKWARGLGQGGAGRSCGMAFPPDIFKETVKRLHCLFQSWLLARRKPSHAELSLYHPGGEQVSMGAGSDFQSMAELQEEPGLSQEARGRFQVPSAAHELCAQCSASAVLQRTTVLTGLYYSWKLSHFCSD